MRVGEPEMLKVDGRWGFHEDDASYGRISDKISVAIENVGSPTRIGDVVMATVQGLQVANVLVVVLYPASRGIVRMDVHEAFILWDTWAGVLVILFIGCGSDSQKTKNIEQEEKRHIVLVAAVTGFTRCMTATVDEHMMLLVHPD